MNRQCRLLNTTKILHGPVQVPSSEKNFEPTEEEINKILDNFRAEYVSRSAKGNIDRLVEMYHPEAVIVHVGQFSKHGHAAIKEVLQKWVKERPNITFEESKLRRFSAGGGEYLFSVGFLNFNFHDGKIVQEKYESIYKLHEGKYLLYYDRNMYTVPVHLLRIFRNYG
uniref:SnoaL-like domain-containing protein n=1 Tax=Acrobeloides nanus TaxID=290746 RepID=A0A914CRC3_9BILA